MSRVTLSPRRTVTSEPQHPREETEVPNEETLIPEGIDGRGARIRMQVTQAVAQLQTEERDIVERYHYMGQSLAEIAGALGLPGPIVQAQYNRARLQLFTLLSPFVQAEFRFTFVSPPPAFEFRRKTNDFGLVPLSPSAARKLARHAQRCPICACDKRVEIDSLISARDRAKTWRPVLKIIRETYAIRQVSVQQVISHEKYH